MNLNPSILGTKPQHTGGAPLQRTQSKQKIQVLLHFRLFFFFLPCWSYLGVVQRKTTWANYQNRDSPIHKHTQMGLETVFKSHMHNPIFVHSVLSSSYNFHLPFLVASRGNCSISNSKQFIIKHGRKPSLRYLLSMLHTNAYTSKWHKRSIILLVRQTIQVELKHLINFHQQHAEWKLN